MSMDPAVYEHPACEDVSAEIEAERQAFLKRRAVALAEAQARHVESLERLRNAEHALIARKERTVELQSSLESWLCKSRQNEMQCLSGKLGTAHDEIRKLNERRQDLERQIQARKTKSSSFKTNW